jgi:hypothetical protein
VYGFKFPTDCSKMEWGDGGTFKKATGAKYEVEHILAAGDGLLRLDE